ncbi:sensor histidine kinase [Pseudomonas anguilliseptica]|uniref:sensor histidine kinase n=1 Tax=Pseudomonas anguilliseptica TaxID=53406 RepID=UPI001F291C1B|nr:HAMP domain-containing sensor histidine kinase [Pseudomonas anguilliseptica]MCE5361838.1 HAMP domain-containing histidine kinase [Pseudomonas anguilliseptica]
MNLARLRLSSVALVAVMFFLSMLAYTLYNLYSLQSALRQDVGENMVWALSQGVYQSARLSQVAARQPRTAADDAEQQMRQSILTANLSMLVEGPQRRFMEHSEVLADISRVLGMLEQPVVDHIGLQQQLQLIGNKVMLAERESEGRDRDRHRQLVMQVILTVLGILLAGSILCVQLLRSLKQVRVASEEISRQHEQARTLLDALQQERAARLRYRDFVSLMSHQLRTPLAVIDSSAQRLLRQNPDQEITQRVQRMRTSVSQLNELISRVLDGVRQDDAMESSTRASSLELLVHDWRDVLAEAMARLDEMLSARPVRVDWREAGEGPLPISCDRLWCVEILCNLLSNADKYSPPGSPIELAVELREEHLYCSVRDFGPGLTDDDRERVFERFYRAQGTRSIAGTGLGLSIARALAQWHGGSLTVCNAEGGGALFTLVLPRSAEL